MGILSALRLTRSLTELDSTAGLAPQGNAGIRSPWATGNLHPIAYADIFKDAPAPASRAQAIRVPALAKGRNVIITALAGQPLVAMRGDTVLPDAQQPTWCYRTSGPVPPWHRMAWTLDDLIFYGWSLWAVSRDSEGRVLEADRVPPEWWDFDGTGGILINGGSVDASQVVLIPGPTAGLLVEAGETIRGALNLETSWQGRVRSPIPLAEIRQTTDDYIDEKERDQIVKKYVEARSDPQGAVVFVPYGFELSVHGDTTTDLFIEGRNATRLDIANQLGLPAAALDGSTATGSLTYVTSRGKRTELADSLAMWMDPITARLSQDDVVPRGQRIAFNLEDRTAQLPTGPIKED